jgi:hypothetical protein
VGTFEDETENAATHFEKYEIVVVINADFQRQGGDEERRRLHLSIQGSACGRPCVWVAVEVVGYGEVNCGSDSKRVVMG